MSATLKKLLRHCVSAVGMGTGISSTTSCVPSSNIISSIPRLRVSLQPTIKTGSRQSAVATERSRTDQSTSGGGCVLLGGDKAATPHVKSPTSISVATVFPHS